MYIYIYKFQFDYFLKPDSSSFNSFRLSWIDKVTTGTSNLVSVIANFVLQFQTK